MFNKSQFFSTREETIKWLDKNYIKNYTINDDLSVDVNNSVEISWRNLKFIPINFNSVTGDFGCHSNQLINLDGSPKSVGGHFYCNSNKLIYLDGSPKSVGWNFDCSHNQLISLANSPRIVGRDFWCDDNKITSLAGSPTTVGYNFNCSNNPLTSLFELNNCTFKNIIFNIDGNILKKEELESLKKYYNFKEKIYILTNEEFHDTLKPILQKNHLLGKLSNTEIYTKTKTPFI